MRCKSTLPLYGQVQKLMKTQLKNLKFRDIRKSNYDCKINYNILEIPKKIMELIESSNKNIRKAINT